MKEVEEARPTAVGTVEEVLPNSLFRVRLQPAEGEEGAEQPLVLAYLAGIPERVGYRAKRRGALLTKIVELPVDAIHRVDSFLNLLRAGGIEAKSRSYEFTVTEEDAVSAQLPTDTITE